MSSFISITVHLWNIYLFLGLFISCGLCQDCELQYVKEPPSSISCNPYMTSELNLKCMVQATTSIGNRVTLLWFFTNTDDVTRNTSQVNDIGRSTRSKTEIHGDDWEMTSYLNLTVFTFPNHAGKWFCQATLDGNLVLPSNMLIIGDPIGSTSCEETQVGNTTRCAYSSSPTSTFTERPSLVSSTFQPSSAFFTSVDISQPTTSIASLETSSAVPSSLLTVQHSIISPSSTYTNIPPTLGLHASTIHSLSPSSLPNPTVFTTTMHAPSTDPTIQVSFVWVYAISAIVIVFAMVILVLGVLFLAFFFLRRKRNSKPLASTLKPSTCDLDSNAAYGITQSVPRYMEDPVYDEIPAMGGEPFYITPDETPPPPKKLSIASNKLPGNDYVTHSEYLELHI